MDFNTAFTLVIGHEGGYVNDPHDPGGETKFGIAKRFNPAEDIAGMTVERAREIYRAQYWDKLNADNLPDGLRHYLFDTAVNCGVRWAAESLQRALGVLPDGVIGPRTVAVAKSIAPQHTLRLMFVDRCMQYALNPNDARYGRGWFARLYDVTALAVITIDPRLSGRPQ